MDRPSHILLRSTAKILRSGRYYSRKTNITISTRLRMISIPSWPRDLIGYTMFRDMTCGKVPYQEGKPQQLYEDRKDHRTEGTEVAKPFRMKDPSSPTKLDEESFEDG
jgi:hypothetical protein